MFATEDNTSCLQFFFWYFLLNILQYNTQSCMFATEDSTSCLVSLLNIPQMPCSYCCIKGQRFHTASILECVIGHCTKFSLFKLKVLPMFTSDIIEDISRCIKWTYSHTTVKHVTMLLMRPPSVHFTQKFFYGLN